MMIPSGGGVGDRWRERERGGIEGAKNKEKTQKILNVAKGACSQMELCVLSSCFVNDSGGWREMVKLKKRKRTKI